MVARKDLHNGRYYQKRGTEVTRGSLYSPLLVPDFPLPFQ